MAIKTTNFNLELPENEDFYDVNVFNNNNRKIDLALQENKDKINNHENKKDEHLKPEQADKIESALQPIQTFTEGNFVKVNSDGTISDSGFSENSFANTDHNEKSVYSEKGVHNLRYHNEKMQVFNGMEWVDIAEKPLITVEITVDSGSAVTATDGTNTVTGTSENNVCTLMIPNYGNWNFSATLNGNNSKIVSLVIDSLQLYHVTLEYPYATITLVNNTKNEIKADELYYKTPDSTEFVKVTGSNIDNYPLKCKIAGDYQFYHTKTQYGIKYTSSVTTFNVSQYRINNEQSYNEFSDFYGKEIKISNHHEGSFKLNITPSNGNTQTFTFNYGDTNNGTFYKLWNTNETVTIELIENNLHSASATVDMMSLSNATNTTLILHLRTFYGFRINENTSSPTNRVEYLYASVNMTPGSDAWDNTEIFNDIYPVALGYDSLVHPIKRLEKGNFKLVEGGVELGGSLGIDWKNYYNIMIHFPTLYYSCELVNGVLTVKLCKSIFTGCKVFKERYIGAYLGTHYYQSMSGFASLPNSSVSTNMSLNDFKAYLNFGRLFNYYDLLMLQFLFILRYKSTDSESALGRGFVSGESPAFTGRLDGEGMYSGSPTSGASMDGIKFCGIEDLWGNCLCYVDGLKIGKQNIMVNGVDKGSISNTSISTYFKNGISSDLPFIQKSNDSGASSSTYYCDRQYIVGRADAETNNIAEFGSVYNGGYGAGGLFSLYMQRTESNIPSSGTSVASRLVYEP